MPNIRRRILLTILLAIFSLSSCGAWAQIPLNAEARIALQQAFNCIDRSEWTLALKHLTEAQKQAPTNSDILYNLGYVSIRLDRPLPAVAWLHACAFSDPDLAREQRIHQQIDDLNLWTQQTVQKLLQESTAVAKSITDDSRNEALALVAHRMAETGSIQDALSRCPEMPAESRGREASLCWFYYARNAAQLGDKVALASAASHVTQLEDPSMSVNLCAYLYSLGLYDQAADYAASQAPFVEQKATANSSYYSDLLRLYVYADKPQYTDAINSVLKTIAKKKVPGADQTIESFSTWQSDFYNDVDSPITRATALRNFEQARQTAQSIVSPAARLETLQVLCNASCKANDFNQAKLIAMDLGKAAALSNFAKEERISLEPNVEAARLTAAFLSGNRKAAQSRALKANEMSKPVLLRQLAYLSTLFPDPVAPPLEDDSDATTFGTMEALLHLKNIDKAESVVSDIKDSELRTQALISIAKWQIANGMPSEADRILQRAELLRGKQDLLPIRVDLCEAFAAGGNVAEAARLAEECVRESETLPPESRLHLLDHIANAQRKIGDRSGAEETRRLAFRQIWESQAKSTAAAKVGNNLKALIEEYIPQMNSTVNVSSGAAQLNAIDVSQRMGWVAVNLSDEFNKAQQIERAYRIHEDSETAFRRLSSPAFITAKLKPPTLIEPGGPTHDPHLWKLPGIPKTFTMYSEGVNYTHGISYAVTGKANWLRDNIYEFKWSNLLTTRATITVDGCVVKIREKGFGLFGPCEGRTTAILSGRSMSGPLTGHDLFTRWGGEFEASW